MPFDYYLMPTDERRSFPPDLVADMHRYLRGLPSYQWEDGSYLLFQTEEDRDRRVPQLLANRERNDYLDPFIHVEEKEVMLSAVVNPDVDRYLYDFVLWCQQRWPCELRYFSQAVSPEALLAEP